MELTAGGILSRLFAMVKGRFGPLLGLWVVYFVVQIVFSGVFFGVIGAGAVAGASMFDPASGGAGMAALGGGMFLLMLVFYLVYLLIYVASYGSLAHMASPLLQPEFGQSFSAGMRASLPLFGAMILLLIGYFVLAIPIALLFGAMVAAGGDTVGLLAILILPVLIYLSCRLSILFPLATVEGIRNPVTLITRSWSLTRGNVLAIFLAMLAYLLVAVVGFAIVFLPLFGPLLSGGSLDAAPGVGAMLVLVLGGIAVGVTLSIMGAALGSAIHGGLSDAKGDAYSDTFA